MELGVIFFPNSRIPSSGSGSGSSTASDDSQISFFSAIFFQTLASPAAAAAAAAAALRYCTCQADASTSTSKQQRRKTVSRRRACACAGAHVPTRLEQALVGQNIHHCAGRRGGATLQELPDACSSSSSQGWRPGGLPRSERSARLCCRCRAAMALPLTRQAHLAQHAMGLEETEKELEGKECRTWNQTKRARHALVVTGQPPDPSLESERGRKPTKEASSPRPGHASGPSPPPARRTHPPA